MIVLVSLIVLLRVFLVVHPIPTSPFNDFLHVLVYIIYSYIEPTHKVKSVGLRNFCNWSLHGKVMRYFSSTR